MAGMIALLVFTATTIILIRSTRSLCTWRPRGVSVVPIAFAVAVTGALMNAGFRGELGQPHPVTPSASPPASSVADAPPASVPVYPGPPTDAPLPKLDLPITFDYGHGPRYPVPGPRTTIAPASQLRVGPISSVEWVR
jgi:hypothetical protein